MIGQRNAEELTGALKTARGLAVLGGGGGIAGGMIMDGDDGGRAVRDRGGENLAGLCCGRSYVVFIGILDDAQREL